MTTAREIMTGGEERAQAGDSLTQAAQRMRDLGVTSLSICGADGRVTGVLTERDILVQCVAEGVDPTVMRVAELVAEAVSSVSPSETLEEILTTMIELGVHRLPVTEGRRLVGVVSQADVARGLPQEAIGRVVAAVVLRAQSGPTEGE